MRILALPLALVLATPLAADEPLTPDEFSRHVAGRTLTYMLDGVPYGIERYMDDRRVIWSFLDGQCAMGRWYGEGSFICFAYDTDPDDPQCWEMYREDGRLRTVYRTEPDRSLLYEAREGDEDLICENFGT
ncbi:hypothetical protein OG2516_07487 [Oceanicola granulosus HTCC2516]|uniref:Uncharacterized protein n=1 Tax=Oceanicola granulosus (strain ATCC BAA-861 / DSM 15982 / KCTC 12143 / HTCC2516) TaxID=314256 RepID=Q2CIF7_OCEGH|nr:hypothetical protein [Oceanicola granulosus]EAR52301.1 hypothetical protein OG2516_07487 [Oceanicola granulosus HTCC2516]